MEFVSVYEDFLEYNLVDVGTAVVTTGGNLQAKYIIHVVTPIWSGGEHGEEEKLGETIHNA